jgi:hypothetical protein
MAKEKSSKKRPILDALYTVAALIVLAISLPFMSFEGADSEQQQSR